MNESRRPAVGSSTSAQEATITAITATHTDNHISLPLGVIFEPHRHTLGMCLDRLDAFAQDNRSDSLFSTPHHESVEVSARKASHLQMFWSSSLRRRRVHCARAPMSMNLPDQVSVRKNMRRTHERVVAVTVCQRVNVRA